MNIRGRLARHLGLGGEAAAPDIMAGPVEWSRGGDSVPVTTKVDHALRIAGHVVVAGWSSAMAGYRLRVGGQSLPTTAFTTPRPDVARYLDREGDDDLGFVLMVEATGDGVVELECLDGAGLPVAKHRLRPRAGRPGADARPQLAPALRRLEEAGVLLPGAEAQGAAPGDFGFAAGALDDARSSEDAPEAVASGWLVARPGVEAWIEAPGGKVFPLSGAHRIRREDVKAARPYARPDELACAGFLVRLPGVVPGDRLKLCVEKDGRGESLAEATCTSWGSDPQAASHWLFAFPTPLSEVSARMATIDLPVLGALIEAGQRDWPALPVRDVAVGPQVEAPRASIIVPLFARFDFVEHQLLEFARDPWLLRNAEIVYVVDDPALVEAMASGAWSLHRLYGVPFRWVWGQVNRGFAGANNLGAAHARGDTLVFLNSDAIPRAPGWLQALVGALDADPGIGAVGPRLLFGDGSLQHAGIEFRYREDLGIWANHHPHMGLDPALDPHAGPTDVPCVTGACLAVRRTDFDRAGGWDTGYLIGDFEDSDLCLKLREAGLRIVYLPQVSLTHLERQSFRLVGKGDYRMRVVIWNAVRHQERWRASIQSLAAGQPGTGEG